MTQGKTKVMRKLNKKQGKNKKKKSKSAIKKSTKQKLFSKIPRFKSNNKKISSAINDKNEQIAIDTAMKNGESLSVVGQSKKPIRSKLKIKT